MQRLPLKKIVIIEGITDDYAWTIRQNFQSELKNGIEKFKNLELVSSDGLVFRYKNLKPSSVDRAPDDDYVYLVGSYSEVIGFYSIVQDNDN